MGRHYLGIDIGGTQIKTVLMDGFDHVLERKQMLTEDDPGSGDRWQQKITSIIEEKWEQYAPEGVQSLTCGISAPGLVDAKNQMTMHMPERLQGIENYNWRTQLGRDIWALNDGHSACLAEYESYYRPKGIQHLLMLTLGTGVGGGVIINGQLYQGHLQRAGHVGHMTVDYQGPPTMTMMPGSLEHAIGNFSVLERTNGQFASVRELVRAYEGGDKVATECWLHSVRKLAVALASLNNILAPEVIVLGGGITEGAGDALMEPLEMYLKECEWRPGGHKVLIQQAQYGSFAGAIGAAYFAKSKDIHSS